MQLADSPDSEPNLSTSQELWQQLERYRTMLAAVGEGVLIVSATGELTEFNRRAIELMDKDHFEFRTIFPVPEDWHIRNAQGRDLAGDELPAGITLRTGKACRNVLLELERPDGSISWLSVNTEPVFRLGEALPYEAVVSFHEITDLIHAWEQLKIRDARQTRMLDAIPDLLFILNAEGKFLDYRVPPDEVLFIPPERFLQRTISEVLPPIIAEPLQQCVNEAIRSGEPKSVAYSGASFGSDRHFEARATTLDSTTVLVIVRDITEARVAAEREHKHQQELAHMSRLNALGEMVAGISHEINQPLQAITNFASAILNELVAEGPLDRGKIRDRFEVIRKQAYRAGEIVKRFRRFSSPITRRSSVTCGELLRETLELLDAEFRRRAVKVSIANQAGETLFIADRVQIQQVLVNLLLNACDALEGNPLNAREIIIRTALNTHTLVIDVIDNGAGLPNVPPGQLFTSFFTTKSSGLGLGLAISRSIMETHGGRLTALNNPTSGATFCMELPLTPVESPKNPGSLKT